ncbi:MAG: M50 family metallopeptidase [Bacteroidales bacterium]|nr:M50 family metallopeptidase [Bacteroidales bacterium]
MNQLQFLGIPVFWLLVIVAFLLPKIPVAGKFFNIINTMIHEFGHALAALLLKGEVIKIQIFNDTSGVTFTKSSSKFASIIISLCGYTFASVTAYLCFFLLSVGYEKWIIAGLSILFLFIMLLWIRQNTYGVIWVLSFTGLNLLLLFYFKNETAIQVAAWFYSLMILIESVWSAIVIFMLSLRDPHQAGDATNLHKSTHVHAVIWGILFLAFAVFMGYKSLLIIKTLI